MAAVTKDTNNAPEYLISCGLLTLLALALCIARIYSRLQPRPHLLRSEPRLSPDDYLIAGAAIASVASYFVAVVSSAHGWGHLSRYVSAGDRIVSFKCLLAQQGLAHLASALVRTSVALSLLRFKSSRPWRYSLWMMIGIQVLAYIGFTVLTFGNCRPLRSFWEKVHPKPRCWDRKYTFTYSYVANIILILMDFALATMPIALLRKLHRPRREKILIGCLMAMGLFATAIAAYIMTLSGKVLRGDTLSTTVKLSLWRRTEILVGLIAACLPCLKSRAEKVLHRIGLFTSKLDVPMGSLDILIKEPSPNSSYRGSNPDDKAGMTPASSTHSRV